MADFNDLERRRALARERQRRRRERMSDHEREFQRERNRISQEITRNERGRISYKIALTETNVSEHYLGSMDFKCSYCNAVFWKQEKLSTSTVSNPQFSKCCLKGKIRLPPISNLPEGLINLLIGQDNKSKEFRKHIRAYNSVMAFASLGAKVEEFNRGISNFKIHGSVYHAISSLLPTDGQPKYAQIYFYDTEHEIDNRASIFSNLDRSIIQLLQTIMHNVNPYYLSFKTQLDKIISLGITDFQNINMKIVLKGSVNNIDVRTYCLPTSSDIAVIMPGDGSEINERDVAITLHDGEIRHINELHSMYDPLHYVLLFPLGDKGWCPGIPTTSTLNNNNEDENDLEIEQNHYERENTNCVTPMKYYSYRCHYRENSYLHLCCKLFQQYVVDQYAKIENLRLLWQKQHQHSIRADLYNRVQDALNNDDINLNNIGQRIILSSSFVGGPRYMHQKYQDAMAIVRKYGKPNLFITFTCNPKWKEIAENLQYNQPEHERADLCVRVFNQKLKSLMEDIVKKQIFGKIVGYIYVVEFQKRGLPHAHILLILNSEDHIEICDIDSVICAEIPHCSDTVLYDVVTRHLMHGPCGVAFLNAPCMDKEKKICKKHFPKHFQDVTSLSSDGFPLYRRRNDGKYVEIMSTKLDNRYVVPYNAFLCRKYNAHINVEYCSTVSSVKYLYKYVYKGSDRAVVQISTANDPHLNEIKSYVDGRYISTSEALWRIFGFPMADESPNVTRLPVHLENQQMVYFRGEENPQQIFETNHETKLTAWFKLNQTDNEANAFYYADIPQYYTWNKSAKKWVKRRRNVPTIGRIYTVPITNRELFYFRLLLHHIPGARSFSDIKTIEGQIFETYKDAAFFRGLIDNDDEWKFTLEEARNSQCPKQLRELFVTILLFCNPQNPGDLWQAFKNDFSEDFYRQLVERRGQNVSRDMVHEKALQEIEKMLRQNNYSLQHYSDMPTVENLLTQPIMIQDELPVDIEILLQQVAQNENILNVEQQFIYNEITTAVFENQSKIYFIDAPGGTGKTFLFNALLKKVRSTNKIALAVASSGIAALLLDQGRTAHSRFKIPLNPNETSTCPIIRQSDLAELIRQTLMIVWDEAPMMGKLVYECVDRTFQDIMQNNLPFGGKVVVFGGDFRQILPVRKHGNRADIVLSTMKYANFWSTVNIRQLRVNMRVQQSEDNFSEYLLNIGEGRFTDISQLIIQPNELSSLIQAIYPFQQHNFELTNRCILTPLNDDVDKINDLIINSFQGEEKIYYSADSVVNESQAMAIPVEYLNTLKSSGLPSHALRLKVGVPIMLMRNLNPSLGLCNGTRLIIKALNVRSIEAEIINGTHKGNCVFIPRITIRPSDLDFPFEFQRKQFPVRPSFAMTINKAQGQTLNHVGLYLPDPVFTHGQLYVALSRVRSKDNIKICCPLNNINDHNIVYHEILN